MLNKKRVLLAAVVVGGTVLVSTSVQAFWGPFSPWNWGGPGWGGPGWGGWAPGGYGYPGYGYGYPGYGYGYPAYGYGYPAYGYGYPGYGYPYATPYVGYPAAAAPAQSSE